MLLCSHFMNSWINIVCLNFSWAGIGVPLDSQHRLFQPFSHASSSTSQEQEGTGIGLSICQVLIFPIMFSSTCIGGYWQFIYFVLWIACQDLLKLGVHFSYTVLIPSFSNDCWKLLFSSAKLVIFCGMVYFCWVLKSDHRFYYIANTCIFSHIFSMI